MERTGVDGGLADITDSRALDHVPHGETLDGLVLADASRAVRAADELDVAAALLVAAVISSLLGLHRTRFQQAGRKCIQKVESPSSPFRRDSSVVSQPGSKTALQRVRTMLTILR